HGVNSNLRSSLPGLGGWVERKRWPPRHPVGIASARPTLQNGPSDKGKLSQDSLHDVRLLHARQLFFESVLFDKQLLMVQAQQMQDGRMPVGNANLVLDGSETQLVGRSIGRAGLDARAGHPGAEGVLVMVAAGFALVLVGGQLSDRQPAELAAPHDQDLA